MKTKITSYPNMSSVDDTTLNSIVGHEREVFGGEEYGEYLFCTNVACRRIQSIEEVYGLSGAKEGYVPLEELEKDGPKMPDCPDCSSATLMMFDPRAIKPIYAKLYRNAYGAIMRDETEAVRGTCIIKATNLRDCFDNINERESYDWDEFREKIMHILGIEAEEDTPVINTNRVGINRPYRDGAAFLRLGTACGSNMTAEHDKLPTFSCVKFGGKALPLLEGIGHEQIVEDEYDAVIIGMKRFGDLKRAFGLHPMRLGKEFGPQIMAASMTANQRQVAEPKPKYYQGSTLLDEIQKAIENCQQKT